MKPIKYTIEEEPRNDGKVRYTVHRNDGTSIKNLHPSEAYSLTAFKGFADKVADICMDELQKDIPENAAMFGNEIQEYIWSKFGPLYQKGLKELRELAKIKD